MKGALDVVSAQGMYLLLISVTPEFLEKKQYLKMIRSKMIDGMLIWGWTEDDTYIHDLMGERIPLAMLQTEAAHVDIDKVIADDYAGMKSIVEMVVAKGHRKISVILPFFEGSAAVVRYKGIMDTLAEHNIKPHYITKTKASEPESGYNAGLEVFEKAPDTTCIIAANDLAAYGVIDAAKQKGVRIPQDVSLTGADGLRQYGQLQLTSYISPSYEIGTKGAQLLIDRIEGKRKSSERLCLPTTLIVGDTVREL